MLTRELEEICVARTMVKGMPGAADQVFLGHLRAEITAREKTVGADDRQGDMMPHSGQSFEQKGDCAPRSLRKTREHSACLPTGGGRFATSTTTWSRCQRRRQTHAPVMSVDARGR